MGGHGRLATLDAVPCPAVSQSRIRLIEAFFIVMRVAVAVAFRYFLSQDLKTEQNASKLHTIHSHSTVSHSHSATWAGTLIHTQERCSRINPLKTLTIEQLPTSCILWSYGTTVLDEIEEKASFVGGWSL